MSCRNRPLTLPTSAFRKNSLGSGLRHSPQENENDKQCQTGTTVILPKVKPRTWVSLSPLEDWLESELGNVFFDNWGEGAGNLHLRTTSLYDLSQLSFPPSGSPSPSPVSPSPKSRKSPTRDSKAAKASTHVPDSEVEDKSVV